MLAGQDVRMDSVTAIAASGMQAASLRLESAAANIVKAEAAGPATTNASQPVTPLLAYDPNAPYTNLQGTVAPANDDLPANLVNLKQAETDFRASLLVYKTSDQMFKTLLDATA
jgi:flagellar basal body rod protein FlgC